MDNVEKLYKELTAAYTSNLEDAAKTYKETIAKAQAEMDKAIGVLAKVGEQEKPEPEFHFQGDSARELIKLVDGLAVALQELSKALK